MVAEAAATTRSRSGAIGDPSVPSGVFEPVLLLRLRFGWITISLVGRLYPGWPARCPAIRHRLRGGARAPEDPTGNGGAIRVGARPTGGHRSQLNFTVPVCGVWFADAFRARLRRRRMRRGTGNEDVLTFAGGGCGPSTRSRGYFTGRRGGLPARRRRHHPRSPTRVADRHRQPVRRHHHRSGRGGMWRYRR